MPFSQSRRYPEYRQVFLPCLVLSCLALNRLSFPFFLISYILLDPDNTSFTILSSIINITMSAAVPPGGAKTLAKRKATQENKLKQQLQNQPTSSRAAGAGGSSATMLKIYNDESQGFKIDPLVVLVLAVAFIFSVVLLHVLAKLTGKLF